MAFSNVAYVNMVLIPTIYTVIFLAFVYRRKMKKDTPEFKAVQYMMLAFSVMSEIIIIVMGVMPVVWVRTTRGIVVAGRVPGAETVLNYTLEPVSLCLFFHDAALLKILIFIITPSEPALSALYI